MGFEATVQVSDLLGPASAMFTPPGLPLAHSGHHQRLGSDPLTPFGTQKRARAERRRPKLGHRHCRRHHVGRHWAAWIGPNRGGSGARSQQKDATHGAPGLTNGNKVRYERSISGIATNGTLRTLLTFLRHEREPKIDCS